MRDQLPYVFQVKTSVEGEDIAVTLRTWNIAMSRFVPITVRLPNFMAASA
jgi:hypothetical protein